MSGDAFSSTVTGVLNCFAYAAAAVSSIVIGAISENFSWEVVFAVFVGASALGCVVCLAGHKQMKKKTNEQDTSAEMAYEAANDDTLDMIENMSLFSALSSLHEKDAMILKLHVIYECSYVEIACIMGMTQTAVRTRYSRTIKKIRQSMEDRK